MARLHFDLEFMASSKLTVFGQTQVVTSCRTEILNNWKPFMVPIHVAFSSYAVHVTAVFASLKPAGESLLHANKVEPHIHTYTCM